jgi:hypothetical protein
MHWVEFDWLKLKTSGKEQIIPRESVSEKSNKEKQ